MTSTIETKLLENINNFYSIENGSNVPNKRKFSVINEIHQRMGWGNCSRSIFAFLCDLFGYMTPRVAQIRKALRVYKVNTYHLLSKHIHEIQENIQNNPTSENVSTAKTVIQEYARSNFPQFSDEEVEYFIDHVQECDTLITEHKLSNFKNKNTAWKTISTAARQKADETAKYKNRDIEVYKTFEKDIKAERPKENYSSDRLVVPQINLDNIFVEPTCKTSVNHDVGYENSLGICTGLNWNDTEQFVYDDIMHQWKGNLPHSVEFKFVILNKERDIIAWEKGNNRTLTKKEKLIEIPRGELIFEFIKTNT